MKYGYSQRLEIVKMVLEGGYSYREVNRLSGIDAKSIRHWVAHYRERGEAGLRIRNGYYDSAFKQSVIRYLQENKVSLFTAAIKFGIPEDSLVRKWMDIYQRAGMDGLCCSDWEISRKMKKKSIKSSHPDEDLRKENELLRAENAYLKKLRALVQERIEREKGIVPPPLKN